MSEKPSIAFTLLQTAALCLALLLFAASPAAAEPSGRPDIPVVSVPLAAWVASRPHALRDTLANFETPSDRTEKFRALLESLLARNWTQAVTQARSMDYLLVTIREGGNTFVIASDDSNTGRDPTVVLNLNPRRDFIVGAPHVLFEAGTGEQAAIFLRDLAGRAAIIAGAHRCASRSFTACDGTTEVCGGAEERFRDSDVGHNVTTLYHAAHVLFTARWPSSIVISLHGMSEDTEGVRTSVIISNGIRADDTQQTVATRFRTMLNRRITQPGAVVSCNLPADAVHDFRRLCGFTNVQGRSVNGDANACRGNVDEGTGRFIHMEQDGSVRQPYAQGWPQIGRHAYHRAFISALQRVLPSVGRGRERGE
jgi:hypothetical protein